MLQAGMWSEELFTDMENLQNEYQLTADERGMVQPLIDNIEVLQKECQSILRAITRLRNLDGNWTLMGDRMVKIEPIEPRALQPQPVTEPNGLAHQER